jgi:hypothetical protein
MEKKFEPIPAFNDHTNCKGHGNWMLDCTFEKEEERGVLIKALDNYIEE